MNYLTLRIALFKQWWHSLLYQAYMIGGTVTRAVSPAAADAIEESFRQAGWTRMAQGWSGKF